MKLTRQELLNNPERAVTLIGMSGAGKTYLSCRLEKWGWRNYSCDYEIGSKYLKKELDAFANAQELSAENISVLHEYLGKLGNPVRGGYDLDIFQKRQKAYYDAEVKALLEMGNVMDRGRGSFVHDSTGSLCEIEDEEVLHDIGQRTLFVYLKTDKESEQIVLQRALDYPKPLFFPKAFLLQNIDEYLIEEGLESVNQMEPDGFLRWVFLRLFEARKPKYQRLADLYGVTIPASAFADLSSSEEFVDIIANHLDDAGQVAVSL
ncbi:MAG: hypothetical protein KAJ29_04850 [Alphaproteobacteria bacterium]|nr:hypothetical protein [Alphaproteobacteria bacterium]